jgi:cytochrome c-type biogenesis protein
MMGPFFLGAASAIWLGVLTSISPCPMVTNIAAIFFIGRHVTVTYQVLLSGLLYTFGRILAYVALGALIVRGILSIPGASNFLQGYMNKIIGPLLILAGMFLLELIQINVSVSISGERMQKHVAKRGIWGAGILGMLFALSFCPVSAALFFGSLIPLSIKYRSDLLLPLLYGIGTGLPVLVFAILVAMGAGWVGRALGKLNQLERWTRIITGSIFILAGIYLTIRHIFLAP